MIQAVIFDLDGVIIDSEQTWDDARRYVVAQCGGRWSDDATTAMQGMSSREWSSYMHGTLAVELPAGRITQLVVDRLLAYYQRGLPLLPGAVDAVRRTGQRWPLGLASSANRVVIDAVLGAAGLRDAFTVVVSSEEVPRGKPAPDVYTEASRRIGQAAVNCAAIEDSTNGIRSALAAGLRVVAVPNRSYPPDGAVLAQAAIVVDNLDQVTPEVLLELGGPGDGGRAARRPR